MLLGVSSLRTHMTDEAWQLEMGLAWTGYHLCGHGFEESRTDVRQLVEEYQPSIVYVEDQREWDPPARDFRDPSAKFTNVDYLATRPDVFRLTVLKDAQQRPQWHRQSATLIGAHAWIVYYHPKLVKHVAPYVREQHLIRTYHSIDWGKVPTFSGERSKVAVLSGAISGAYPLRRLLFRKADRIPGLEVLHHPGYGRTRVYSNDYLKQLSQYKVAICTASCYGYALRKLIEATAAGCRVVTTLPVDDVMPGIDGNLTRVSQFATIEEVNQVVQHLAETYDPSLQERYVEACRWYDFRQVGERLSRNIERLRASYN
jgi:hypothetical protein